MPPTRFPYGIGFIKPGANSGEYTLSASATPDVTFGTVWFTAASALTITNFRGGERGKIIILVSGSNGATTVQNSAGGINIRQAIGVNSAGFITTVTTGNYLMQNHDVLQFVHNGTDWDMIGAGIRIP